MPTVPVHQGCAASQAITSSASSCSCCRYSSQQHAVGFAAAAHVDAHRRHSRGRRSRDASAASRGGRAVALAIGQVFEDRRHRVGLGVLGQPDPRRQPAAVPERDEDVLDLAHRPRQARRRVAARCLPAGRRRPAAAEPRSGAGDASQAGIPRRCLRAEVEHGTVPARDDGRGDEIDDPGAAPCPRLVPASGPRDREPVDSARRRPPARRPRLAAGGCRARPGAGDPRVPALPQARRHGRGATR